MSILDREPEWAIWVVLLSVLTLPICVAFVMPVLRIPDHQLEVLVSPAMAVGASWLVAMAFKRLWHLRRARRSPGTFHTETDAKRFIVAKVIEEAEREGVPLSPAQRHMLSWSEFDPDFAPDLSLAATQEDEIPQEEFERKIAGLIRRAYDRDAAADAGARVLYRDAHRKLSEGDHYILIAMEKAL